MKIRHQLLILVGVPLLFQMGSAGFLISSLLSMERAAKREAGAKRVLSICDEIRSSLVWRGLLAANQTVFAADQVRVAQSDFSELIDRRSDELTSLVKDDLVGLQLIYKFKAVMLKAAGVLADLVYDRRAGSVSFSRFLDKQEYENSLFYTLGLYLGCDAELRQHFSPLVRELQPEARRERERTFALVILLAVLNSAAIGGLALVFARTFVSRLSLVEANIAKFSGGRGHLNVLEGNDELAGLDSKFREMAEARWRAEDSRKAMVAMVSHDLRSPLTSSGILLETLLAAEGADMKPAVYRRLRKLHSEMQRVVRLADGLLDIERLEMGQLALFKRSLRAHELVESSILAVSGLAEAKDVSLELNCDDGFVVYCDPDRLIQVLINLLSNAVKFTPHGSSVTVVVTQESPQRARFSVMDQGPGISDEDKSMLFNKFSQLDQDVETKKQGTGLGLYISKLLVNAHHGEIGFSNNPQGGGCFWFEIPIDESVYCE